MNSWFFEEAGRGLVGGEYFVEIVGFLSSYYFCKGNSCQLSLRLIRTF